MKKITDLKSLIESIPASTKKDARKLIAEKIGLKEPSIRSMANGNRKISAEQATELSRHFDIQRSSLRPDLFSD